MNVSNLTREAQIRKELREDEHPGIYPQVNTDIETWKLYELSQDKVAFCEKLVKETWERIQQLKSKDGELEEELSKTIYLENIRLKQDPWKIDSKEEKAFWENAKKRLLQRSIKSMSNENEQEDDQAGIYKEIINSYAQEIIGNFEPKSYAFASKALPFGFNRLLNASNRSYDRFWGEQFSLTDNIKPFGYIDEIRRLSKLGTVVLLPTHHSNLDSILIGWCLHSLGLEAFQYGAGLNLYNNPIMKYFFSRLGAYKIDRRKKNLFYLETLKAYSRYSTLRGVPSIFFPGGTRSRDGQLEERLKLGLVGTVMDAQRINFQEATPENPAKKIFAVPMVLNYHFVLEAEKLISQHLKKQGQEKYFIDKQALPGIHKITKFLYKFLGAKSEVFLSIGKPMDLFGNDLDAKGNSIDKDGNIIQVRDYFVSGGKITADYQRDSVYTRMLGEEISKRFYRENIVLSSHIVTYAAFSILSKKHRRLDLYGLLRLPKEDRQIPKVQFYKVVESLRQRLLTMDKEEQVRLSSKLYGDLEDLIEDGLKNSGIYHPKKVLKIDKEGNFLTDDMNLLYFYHNRLKGYELEKYV